MPIYLYFLIGFGLIYIVRRRKFNNRNSSGLEEFHNFEHSVASSSLNILLKIIAYIILISGVMKCTNDGLTSFSKIHKTENKTLKK